MPNPEKDKHQEGELKERKPKVTIIGSFRFKKEIDEVITFLEENGVEVLEPKKGKVIGERVGSFKVIEGEPAETIEEALEIERRFIKAVVDSDAVYLVNPGGYSGTSSAWELGSAMAGRVPIYAMEVPQWDEPDHPAFHMLMSVVKVAPAQQIPELAKIEMRLNESLN